LSHRDPFLLQLGADFLEARTDLLDFAHQAARARVELFLLRVQRAGADPEIVGVREQLLRVGIGGARVVGLGFGESDFALPFGLLLLDLADLLVDRRDLVGFAVEAFVAMARHAAAQAEDFAPGVQVVGHFGDHLPRVTLLAAGLNVLLVVQRPQPEFVVPVRLLHAGERRSVAAVAGRAAETFGVVNLEQFLIGMAGKHLFAAHACLGERNRLPRAEVAAFAAIHQVDVLDVDLADLDVELIERVLHRGQGGGAGVGDAIRQVLIAFRTQIGGLFHQVDALLQESRLFVLPGLELIAHLLEVHDARLVFTGERHLARLLLQLCDLLAQGILGALAVRDFDLVSERADVAANFLERLVQRQNLGHHVLIDVAVDLRGVGRGGLFGGRHVGIEALIFGRRLDLRL
jgi:hypothetical protein